MVRQTYRLDERGIKQGNVDKGELPALVARSKRPRLVRASGLPISSGARTATTMRSRMPMFGRLARWRNDRIGGTEWYLDCELAEGYADLAPARKPKVAG